MYAHVLVSVYRYTDKYMISTCETEPLSQSGHTPSVPTMISRFVDTDLQQSSELAGFSLRNLNGAFIIRKRVNYYRPLLW